MIKRLTYFAWFSFFAFFSSWRKLFSVIGIFNFPIYHRQEEKKKKKQVVESSSDSSDSSSDSESSDSSSSASSSSEKVVKKPTTNGKSNGKASKKVESSSSSGSSSDSSDESSDSESSSSSSDKKSKKRKEATPAKKVEASSSSSSDSSSESSDDSSSDSSSSSSSDSSSEEVVSKPAAKKQKLSEDSHQVTAKDSYKSSAAPAAAGGSRLYIRNLPWTIQDGDIHTFFADCGTVSAIKWIENKETGRFTGSGIVDFETAEAAAAAVAKNGADLGGRPVGIEYSRANNNANGGGFGNNGGRQDRGNFKRQEASNSFDKKNARAPTPKPDGCRTVFVGNLSFSVDDAKITEFFSDCGEVREIRWVEKDGQFKGCGFLEFSNSDATDGAVAKNGQAFLGRPIRIDFATGKGQ